jgi:uncharacterized protein with HEPN domain
VRRPAERLRDILEAIARIERHTRRGRAAFEKDELIQTGMRDVLIHRYFDVDTEIVWRVVEDHLPVLRREVAGALRKLEA